MTGSPARWPALIGSRFSIDSRAWLLVTPIGIIAAPLAAAPGSHAASDLGHWLLIGVLAQLPMGIVMLAGGVLAARLPWPRTSVIIVTLLAGAARGFALAVLGETPNVAMRVVASAITMSIWLLVLGAARESHHRYRLEVDALLGSLVARELQGRLLDADATDSARESSSLRIAETSSELRAIVTNEAGEYGRTAMLLQAAIETRLRPLSHDLWFSPSPLPPQAHGHLDLARRILTAKVPVAPLVVAALILLSWGSYVLHGVWEGTLVGVAISASYGAVLALTSGNRLTPFAGAWMRYLGVAIVPAMVGELAIEQLGLGEPWSPIAVALGLPAITAAVAAATTLRSDRAQIIDELRDRLAQPEWDRHLGELVRREVDASAATMLHNTVQPALTAAALQLQLAAALDEPERARSALVRAARALDAAQNRNDDPPSGRERLEQVAEAWQGIADVEIRLPIQELNPREWGLLADVANETIANAVRHGKATALSFDIHVGPCSISLTVTENSVAARENESAGLGRTWLNTVVTSSENLNIEGGRAVRLLEIPRTHTETEHV